MTPLTCTSNLVYLCVGVFRGHKSLNRIKLSQFIQDFLLIWAFAALGKGHVSGCVCVCGGGVIWDDQL